MKKRIVSLLLALLLFAAMPVMSAHVFADANTFEYRIGAETMRKIKSCNSAAQSLPSTSSLFESRVRSRSSSVLRSFS